jgi:hypothetical protein
VVSARRLLQYFQLRDKTSSDISRYIYNFLYILKIVMYLLHNLSEPLTMFCGTLRLRGTLLEKHWTRHTPRKAEDEDSVTSATKKKIPIWRPRHRGENKLERMLKTCLTVTSIFRADARDNAILKTTGHTYQTARWHHPHTNIHLQDSLKPNLWFINHLKPCQMLDN